MSNSLRDQLLQLGFKPPARPEPAKPPRADGGKARPARPAAGPRKNEARGAGSGRAGKAEAARGERSRGEQPAGRRRDGGRRSQAEIDLGKAYALRAAQEKAERIAAEQAKQEAARRRREARARLAGFVADKGLNDPAAEIARHFHYGGKIKRVYVTAEQLRALNAGELGVLQLEGRYLLVTAAVLAEAEAIFAEAVALKVDPDAAPGDDPYADPQYQVPDDLVW